MIIIDVRCQCGKKFSVNEDLVGQTITCLRCGREVPVPLPAAKRPATTEPGAVAAAVPDAPDAPVVGSARDSMYWFFLLFFLPLVVLLAEPNPPTIKKRIERSVSPEQWKALEKKIESGRYTIDQILDELPNRRAKGAFLPRNTLLHWAFAAVAALVFWSLGTACFQQGVTEPRYLLYVGLATGTVGICLFLTAHLVPFLAIFVELCMAQASNPDSDFLVVFSGFTFGVGMLEETCKLLPLIWYYYRHHTISWRLACLWGLASGAGFGISEGIHYSEMLYNGLEGPTIYIVRFASCVALHAIWTGSAGITMASNPELWQEWLRGHYQPETYKSEHIEARIERKETAFVQWTLLAMAILRVIVVPMFLHGLYNAALTRELHLLALLAASVSFAWLAWQIESCRRAEQRPKAELEPEAA
ncbi:MAG: PrsW family intramembrane metalloprotease [Planctomycetia bacterium]|nr:PrsW family intramembrane metalloprotease [Planctomycetia bacterium]